MQPARRRPPSRHTSKRQTRNQLGWPFWPFFWLRVPLLAFVLVPISASFMTPSVSVHIDANIHIDVSTHNDGVVRSRQKAIDKPRLRPTRLRRNNCAKGERNGRSARIMKMVTCVLSLLSLVLAMVSTPALAADVYSYGSTGTYIAVDGEIIKGDLAKLAATYERIRGGTGMALIVDFNSPGGDLSEAMAMGRWIRHAKGTTGVRPRSSCASACVYIFAAGVDKWLIGPLIVHRPYLMNYPAGGVDAALKDALAASRSYFAEMNIPESLADLMFSISPDSGRLLTPTEIDEYRLQGTDMATEEDRVLKLINKLGISRPEYMRRLHEYQHSPELAHCLSLQGNAKFECARKAAVQYGIDAGD